jgi:hypothetical protein
MDTAYSSFGRGKRNSEPTVRSRNPMKKLVVVSCLCALLLMPCMGQTYPGLQLIQPDPENGRPALVATPCGGPNEFSFQNWVSPLQVYDDASISMFVDKTCIIAAVQMGYEQTGKYMVALYTHYKSGDYPCKHPLIKDGGSNADYQHLCKMIGYRVRWINVDTRAKKMISTRSVILDIKGLYAASESGKTDWVTFADFEREPIARPMLGSIEGTTKLIEKELEYWKYIYNQK